MNIRTTTFSAIEARPIERATPKANRSRAGTSLSPYSNYGGMFFGNRNIDTLQYYVSWSYSCINRLSWGGSTRRLIAFTEAETKGQLDRTELLYAHWLPRLLRNPNPELSPIAVWLLGYKWLLLNGNCYYWVERDAKGIPQYLWPLPANRVQILLGGKGQSPVIGYRYYNQSGEIADIPAEEILHIAEPEPSELSPFIGASRMLAAMDAIQVDAETMAYLARYFHNDATPAFAVQHPERMDDEQFETWKARFNETFQGSHNAGKWVFLEDNMQIAPITSNGRQSEMQSMDLVNRERICIVFGVPEPYLTGKHQNKATSETVREEFYNLGVHPLVELFTQGLTRYVRRIDASLVVDFDRYQYQDPADERAEMEVNVRLGIKTAEEYRLERGLEPLPAAKTSSELRSTVGGAQAIQTLLIAYSTGQVERESAIATATIIYGLESAEAQAMFPERGATTTPPVDIEEAEVIEDAPDAPTATKALRAHDPDALTEKALVAYWKRYDAIAEGGAASIERGVTQAYKRLEKTVLANLASKSVHEWLTKEGVESTSLFDVKDFKKLLKKNTASSLDDLFDRVGREVFDEAGENADDLKRPFSERIADALEESTSRITTAADTTKADLEDLLKKNRGLPVDELTDKIREKFRQYADGGAKRIAQTTATYATGAAQQTAGKTLVEEVDNIEKVERIWLSQRSGNVRPAHQAADGQVANEDDRFIVNGESISHPGDGSARNAINCRCATRLRIKRTKEGRDGRGE